MANDFSTDTTCKALWRFESGALTADSKGANTLTAVGPPVEETTIKKEGGASALIGLDQCFYIPDANLSAGFPLKLGDATKKITVCGWFYFTAYGTLFSKMDAGGNANCSFGLTRNSQNKINFTYYKVGYNFSQYLATNIVTASNQWYHIGLVADGISGAVKVRIWNDVTQTATEYNGTMDGELNVGNLPWQIFGWTDNYSSYGSGAQGYYDEIVVFADTLKSGDIDNIRQGLYDGTRAATIVSAGGSIAAVSAVNGVCINPTDIRTVAATGGVAVGGNSVVSVKTPQHIQLIGEGGVKVGGASTVAKSIKTIRIVKYGAGGVKVGGNSEVNISRKTLHHSIVASGGVVVGGSPDLTVGTKIVSIVASGGVTIGGRFFPEVIVTRPSATPWHDINIHGSGGVEISGNADLKVYYPKIVSLDGAPAAVTISGKSVLVVTKPIEFDQISSEAHEDEVAAAVFDTWALNDNSQLASIYTGFKFNSYAVFDNQGYGAGPDGVFLLEGDDDDGATIRTGIRLKKTNFGIPQIKRLRSVDLNDGNEDAQLRIYSEDNEGTFPRTRGWMVSRDLAGRDFIIDVLGFEELSQMTIIPVVLNKRR